MYYIFQKNKFARSPPDFYSFDRIIEKSTSFHKSKNGILQSYTGSATISTPQASSVINSDGASRRGGGGGGSTACLRKLLSGVSLAFTRRQLVILGWLNRKLPSRQLLHLQRRRSILTSLNCASNYSAFLYSPCSCLTTKQESPLMDRPMMDISKASSSPTMLTSYSAMLLEHSVVREKE